MLAQTQISCSTEIDADDHTNAGGTGTDPVDGREDEKGNICHCSSTISNIVDNVPKFSVCILLNFYDTREGVSGEGAGEGCGIDNKDEKEKKAFETTIPPPPDFITL